MKTELFSIYDSKAARFTEPWPAPTIDVAIRRFRHTVNQGENDFSRFPEDYTLFHVGSYDQESGLLAPLSTPHPLGVAITFVEKADSEQLKLLDGVRNA